MKKLTAVLFGLLISMSLFLKIDVHANNLETSTFTDVSFSSGTRVHRSTWGNPIWGDFDNDGQLDIFIINHFMDPPSLFRNNGDGTFTDRQHLSGISVGGDRHGAAWGDYDNDGYLDLFITLGAGRGKKAGTKADQLYRNNGDGTFTDVTVLAGVTNAFGRGRSVNWVDYNNDGYLDLFIKNEKSSNVLYRNNSDGTFTDVAVAAGLADAPGEVSAWADYDGDGYMDLFITSAAKDQLWKNNGDGTFTEVTEQAGIKSLPHGQGVAWGDYNNNGHIDLFVARGYRDINDSLGWGKNFIIFSDLENDGENGLDFTSSGNQIYFDLYLDTCPQPRRVFVGRQRSSPATLPLTLTDQEAAGKPSYTRGEDRGFFIWKDDTGWHLRWVSNRLNAYTYVYGKITTNGQFLSVRPLKAIPSIPLALSTLYRNNGDGTFTDITTEAGVGSNKNNRGAIWGDFDNDGYMDLYIVNSGSFERNGPNTLFRNNGDGTFQNITDLTKVWSGVNGRGDGAAWGDFSNSGFLDLYITNGWGRPIMPRHGNHDCLVPGPHVLYKNDGNDNHWFKIKLIGTTSNRDAIGAKLRLQSGGMTQYREVNGSGGGQYFSQGSGPIHFGLGQARVIDSLVIQWPSGITQEFENLSPNQQMIAIEE